MLSNSSEHIQKNYQAAKSKKKKCSSKDRRIVKGTVLFRKKNWFAIKMQTRLFSYCNPLLIYTL